ncbi:flagellar type III secretion system protein FliQ [Roseomonas sp. NAR14]|uniref:Flagellar type III secretion system protein FliQ n=1 Tax=Roseomonas acroporae TaxID=2937791 RepID=A0A9X1Y2J5_9PROT|nr:flagellar biosynthetic protein FliQ [Roseomonas acroporae]MCK8782769.1 flagellar type III secretion system protein FliQ [Roseomonas acroporae]
MTSDAVPLAAQESLWLALQLAGPLLLALLLVGLAVAVFQALTQINEQTVSFLPKLGVLLALLLLLGPNMAGSLRAYATTLFDRIVSVGGAP